MKPNPDGLKLAKRHCVSNKQKHTHTARAWVSEPPWPRLFYDGPPAKLSFRTTESVLAIAAMFRSGGLHKNSLTLDIPFRG